MIQGGLDMTTEEFLNSSEAVILVDRRGYEITEKTRTYAVYESAIIQFLKEERQKKFWKFRISKRKIEETIAANYLMHLVDNRKELLKYPLEGEEEYKLPFHFRLAHTFTWNPDAQKLLELLQKYLPMKNFVDTEMLDEMKFFFGVKKRIEVEKCGYIFEEVLDSENENTKKEVIIIKARA